MLLHLDLCSDTLLYSYVFVTKHHLCILWEIPYILFVFMQYVSALEVAMYKCAVRVWVVPGALCT